MEKTSKKQNQTDKFSISKQILYLEDHLPQTLIFQRLSIKRFRAARKPGSVSGNHLSRRTVTSTLQQAETDSDFESLCLSILSLCTFFRISDCELRSVLMVRNILFWFSDFVSFLVKKSEYFIRFSW